MNDKTRRIDAIDRRILVAIQENAKLTADQLGGECGLSPTAALKRLKRLRDDKIIEGEVAIVSPKAVGFPVLVLVLVTLERESSDVIDRFKKAIKSSPEIMQGYYITGDSDFLLMVVAESMDQYEEFSRSFFYERHQIKSFKTLVVLDRIKAGYSLPIGLQ